MIYIKLIKIIFLIHLEHREKKCINTALTETSALWQQNKINNFECSRLHSLISYCLSHPT